MNRKTHQALSTLTRDHLAIIEDNINDVKSGLKYWLPKCDPERKADLNVREAYENLNRLKNRLRTLRAQRTKWTKTHELVIAPLKVTKKPANHVEAEHGQTQERI